MNPDQATGDALVEAVTAKDNNDRDANDNIIDRITGKEIHKPGDEAKHEDIVVPSVSGGSKKGASSSPAPEGEVEEEEQPERRPRAVVGRRAGVRELLTGDAPAGVLVTVSESVRVSVSVLVSVSGRASVLGDRDSVG